MDGWMDGRTTRQRALTPRSPTRACKMRTDASLLNAAAATAVTELLMRLVGARDGLVIRSATRRGGGDELYRPTNIHVNTAAHKTTRDGSVIMITTRTVLNLNRFQ